MRYRLFSRQKRLELSFELTHYHASDRKAKLLAHPSINKHGTSFEKGPLTPMGSDALSPATPLISVCVCTYRRPRQLHRLLQCLDQQVTNDLFNFSIVVIDNDERESAQGVVERWAKRICVPLIYSVEPRQNIALARNASVALATGDLVAFVDDDEEPSSAWLRKLYEVFVGYDVDGVIGAVVPRFEERAPSWAVKGGVFRRPIYKTGSVIDWRAAATNNALVKRDVLQEFDGPFRAQFGAGGEDQDLFRRAISRGRVFAWSAEALCYEPVPTERTKVAFQLRRALLRGKIAARTAARNRRGILKSTIALPAYVVSLPVCLLMGSHVFVTQLVRTFDHLGKLLTVCGIDVAGETYIS